MATRSLGPVALAVAGGCALALPLMAPSSRSPCSVEDCRQGAAFVLPAAGGSRLRSVPQRSNGLQGCCLQSQAAGAGAGASSSTGFGSVLAFAAVAMLCRAARSRVTRFAAGQRMPKYYTHERKWWSIEETRDPTTLPIWQRDFRFGFQVLKRTMVEHRKKGKRCFWDVRVIQSKNNGCVLEMLNSGLLGWCPASQEGPERLEEGAEVKMECIRCPQKRVNKERHVSPWPQEKRGYEMNPVFSHNLYLEQQASISKAKVLEAGTIVKGKVFRHIGKGMLIALEGENAPKGMLAMMDVSRKMSSHTYCEKMFPPGTDMKCYVVHADAKNGRITLSTKEFEDDDHMGWMLSFPERCFAMADEAVERYHEKREAYIAWAQR